MVRERWPGLGVAYRVGIAGRLGTTELDGAECVLRMQKTDRCGRPALAALCLALDTNHRVQVRVSREADPPVHSLTS